MTTQRRSDCSDIARTRDPFSRVARFAPYPHRSHPKHEPSGQPRRSCLCYKVSTGGLTSVCSLTLCRGGPLTVNNNPEVRTACLKWESLIQR
jgi:hypothetical protein